MAEAVTGAELFGSGGEHELLTPEEAQYAALTYINMGWAVMPGAGLDADGQCACRAGARCANPGKHAYGGWGNETRRKMTYDQAARLWDPRNVRWKKYPVDQVFIVPYLSGLVVADVDDMGLWMSLGEEHRPETLWQQSGSGRGGHFVYEYHWDTTQTMPPSMPGRLLKKAGEVKFRGIIAGAPCPHSGGGRYQWMNWGHEVVPAPKSLVEKHKFSTDVKADWDSIVRSKPGDNPWFDLMYVSDCGGYRSVAEATSGRPVVLFAVAAQMAKWIESGHTTEEEVVERLLSACEENSVAVDRYGHSELERQIRNGIETGLRERRMET